MGFAGPLAASYRPVNALQIWVARVPLLDRGTTTLPTNAASFCVARVPLLDRGPKHLDGGERLNQYLTLPGAGKAKPVLDSLRRRKGSTSRPTQLRPYPYRTGASASAANLQHQAPSSLGMAPDRTA